MPIRLVHPGEVVRDYIETKGWTQADFARRLDLTPKTISKLVNGKASIQPYMAVKFEMLFERPAQFWLQLQANYDLQELEK